MRDTRHQAWYLRPYFQLGLSAVLLSAAEVLMKKGATASLILTSMTPLFNVGALAWSVTWIGIVLYVVSFISWLYVLRLMPVTQAYCLINVVHVLVPAAAWLFLLESISLSRAAGIALVLGGTLLVGAPTTQRL
jgi:drug/metabolite transporter (DMT)-like permease